MRKQLSIVIVLALSTLVHAGVDFRWTAETSEALSASVTAYRGETLTLEATLKSYGETLQLPGDAVASIYWQTNGMAATWWTTNAVAGGTNGTITAMFSPEMDVGASRYTFFLGLSSSGMNYRANGIINIKGGPGSSPNALELPRQSIDFSTITVLNPPWATSNDIDAQATAAAAYIVGTNAAALAQAARTVATNAQTTAGEALDTATNAVSSIEALPINGSVWRSAIMGDSNNWLSIDEGINPSINRRTATTDIVVVSVADGELSFQTYNGPPVGTVWKKTGDDTWAATNGWIFTHELNDTWMIQGANMPPVVFSSQEGATPPMTLQGMDFGNGSLVIDWVYAPASSRLLEPDDIMTLAPSNWVESVRGVWTDVATNVTYSVVVSNGHWLVREVQ